jgi:hypothetical protein
VAQAAQ